jgi:DNA-binding MarR family transcriptional regulator
VDEEILEVAGCTCLRLRRAARRATQVYDRALAPVGITVNQFGMLANLYGANLAGAGAVSIGTLAERLGTDATTLNRTLKPLISRSLVDIEANPVDARIRLVAITNKGTRELRKAIPLWRQAQNLIQVALGHDELVALNGMLDHTNVKLAEDAAPTSGR